MKTSELTGAALDWAVAKCEGWPMGIWYDEDGLPMIRDDEVPEYKPSTDWSQGGPIIEREWIILKPHDEAWYNEAGYVQNWCAVIELHEYTGETPLIAAMRCYVASKLGDEVKIPEGLL